ncbi:MAG: glycosyltransferase family 4 protein [Candidatus Bilamarchaeaceae archaeon]
MKILQAVHAFPPSQGGIEHHVYHLSKELVKMDNEVVVVTTNEKGQKSEEKLEGIEIKRLPAIKFPLFSAARLPIGACITMIKENADIYASHGYGSIMPLFTAMAALVRKKPFIFTLHGYPIVKGKRKIFYYFYRLFIAPVFLALATKVIVVSRASLPFITKEVSKNKIVYIPNGIDEKFDCKLDYENKKYITYIGRLDEDKGIDILIKAYSRINKKYPNLKLQIVGKDEGIKNKLQKLAEKLNVELIFKETPYDRIKEVYCESKAIVLPSKYEGFSLVWLEATASGRPMFSTPVGEAPAFFEQVYEKNKDLFLFKDENELVKKLDEFLTDENKYKKIIERAKYIVHEEYSWENIALQTLNVYKEIVKK